VSMPGRDRKRRPDDHAAEPHEVYRPMITGMAGAPAASPALQPGPAGRPGLPRTSRRSGPRPATPGPVPGIPRRRLARSLMTATPLPPSRTGPPSPSPSPEPFSGPHQPPFAGDSPSPQKAITTTGRNGCVTGDNPLLSDELRTYASPHDNRHDVFSDGGALPNQTEMRYVIAGQQ
jgi:hypothetical protein